MILSHRARTWLEQMRMRRVRPAYDDIGARSWLRVRSRPVWDALVDVEVALGGLLGVSDDGRVIAFGVHDWFGRVRVVDGRPGALVAYFDPCCWFVCEDGAVAEVDDCGGVVYVSDSITHRIEQIAVWEWPVNRHVEVIAGRKGEVLSKALGLEPLIEASDQWQQLWVTPQTTSTTTAALLVRQSFEPGEDGGERVWRTWLASGEPALLAASVELLRN